MQPPHFDSELLGLRFELVNWLGDHGFQWFDAFQEVEADLGNRELKVNLSCPYEGKIVDVIGRFARENGFAKVFFSDEKGAVYLRRR